FLDPVRLGGGGRVAALSGVGGDRADSKVKRRLNRRQERRFPDPAVTREDRGFVLEQVLQRFQADPPGHGRLQRRHADRAVVLQRRQREFDLFLALLALRQIRLVQTDQRRYPAPLAP